MPSISAAGDTKAKTSSRTGSAPSLRLVWQQAAKALEAVGVERSEARLEAEILLCHVLGIAKAAFLVRLDDPLFPDAQRRFHSLLQRRERREPLAYIVGRQEIYGLSFLVDARVLIPRPETEGLVERVIAYVQGKAPRLGEGAAEAEEATARGDARRSDSWPTILDVGTGSGCIAVALAVHLPHARFLATDASPDALALGLANASQHGVADRIRFLAGDLLGPAPSGIDIIVANPPYVRSGEIEKLALEIARWEPRAALDGGADGFDAIRRLLAQAPEHLAQGGALFLEIGDGQGAEAARLAQAAFPAAAVRVERDLGSLERYIVVEDTAR